MAIIDQDGLFHGDRLKDCSDLAQLYWPRFLLASNGMGRVKIDPTQFTTGPLASLKTPPTMDVVIGLFREYHANYLGFMYIANGELWAQWDVPTRLLSRYQTAADRRSPAPPEVEFRAWKDEYQAKKKSKALDLLNCATLHKTDLTTDNSVVSENSQTTPNHIDSHRLGIGIGDGKGKGKIQKPAAVAADPRFREFVDAVSKYWEFKNPGIPLAFGAAEGKQLNRLLADNPNLDLGLFQTCLNHRARSDVVHSEPPRFWLATAIKYAGGPIDRFNKPPENGNGNRKNRADERIASIADTTLRAARRIAGGIPGDDPADVGIRSGDMAQSTEYLPPARR